MMTSIPPDVRSDGRYTVGETARILGVHRDTIGRWEKAGRLHPKFDKHTLRKRFTGREILRFWNATI